jgi:hypothetical protein
MPLVRVFASALILYGATLAPTVIWGDSAWYTLHAARGPISIGTAADHPLYLLLGRMFIQLPGDPARNMALLSALWAALAVMLVYRICTQLGTSGVGASVGAAALAVSHGFWLHAVMPEVYTAHACFVLAIFTVLLTWRQGGGVWRLAFAALLFAVGLTNHLVLAVVLPAIVVFVCTARPPALSRPLIGVLGVLVLLTAAALVVDAGHVRWALYRLWVGPPGIADYFRLDVPLLPMVREVALYVAYLAYQFPSLSILLVALGLRNLWTHDRPAATFILTAVSLNALTFVHNTAWVGPAKFVFYISDYALYAVACGMGAERLLARLAATKDARHQRAWGGVVLALVVLVPAGLYRALPVIGHRLGVQFVRVTDLPYRDGQAYFLYPGKRGYDGARRFAEETMRSVPPFAVIYADYTPFSVLRYLQLMEGVRPDVLLRYAAAAGAPTDQVAVEWVTDNGRPRPVFVASQHAEYYDMSRLNRPYDLIPTGPVFEVRPRD